MAIQTIISKKFIFFLFILSFTIPSNSQNSIGIECKGCDTTKSGRPKVIKQDSIQPYIVLNGMAGGYLDSNSIDLLDSLKVFIRKSGGQDSTSCRVVSYSCLLQTKKGAKSFPIAGSAITPRLKEAMKSAQNGDLVIFFAIVIRNEEGKETKITSGPAFRIRKE